MHLFNKPYLILGPRGHGEPCGALLQDLCSSPFEGWGKGKGRCPRITLPFFNKPYLILGLAITTHFLVVIAKPDMDHNSFYYCLQAVGSSTRGLHRASL